MKVGYLLKELKDLDENMDILFLEFVNDKPRVRFIDGLQHCTLEFLDASVSYLLIEAGSGYGGDE